MTPPVQRAFPLVLALLTCLAASLVLAAPQDVVNTAARAAATLPAPPPVPKSPVDSFRELLAMKPAERELYFTNRPPQIRVQLEQKIREYEAMTPEVRDARLRATQLHWYLSRFIPAPASNATIQLSAVPEGYRAFVSNRLSQFQLLPPGLRQDVLAHPTSAGYFLGRATTNPAVVTPLPPLPPPLVNVGKLPPAQREKIYSGFARFIDMSAEQKKAVIERLPPADRSRVGPVLLDLDRLPAGQRERGLQSIGLLLKMTGDQQRELLGNAERWKELPVAERQVWTNLVKRLPPLPPGALMPPFPTLPTPVPRGSLPLATNPPN